MLLLCFFLVAGFTLSAQDNVDRDVETLTKLYDLKPDQVSHVRALLIKKMNDLIEIKAGHTQKEVYQDKRRAVLEGYRNSFKLILDEQQLVTYQKVQSINRKAGELKILPADPGEMQNDKSRSYPVNKKGN